MQSTVSLEGVYVSLPNSDFNLLKTLSKKMGWTIKRQRKSGIEKALDDVSNGNIRVLCSSYKLAKEGLDIPRLSNIILASPVKDEAVVIQSIGRIQRPFEGKEIAMVYDITDNQVSTLTRFFRKRNALYKKKGWL